MATTANVKGSPVGVITAAAITITTMACRRYVRNVSLDTIPSKDKSHVTSGNSNATPCRFLVVLISFFFGSCQLQKNQLDCRWILQYGFAFYITCVW